MVLTCGVEASSAEMEAWKAMRAALDAEYALRCEAPRWPMTEATVIRVPPVGRARMARRKSEVR